MFLIILQHIGMMVEYTLYFRQIDNYKHNITTNPADNCVFCCYYSTHFPLVCELDTVQRQYVPNNSKMFQIIIECSRSFQNNPDYFRLFQTILKCSRLLQNVLDYSRMFNIILEYPRSFQSVPDNFRIIQNQMYISNIYISKSISDIQD